MPKKYILINKNYNRKRKKNNRRKFRNPNAMHVMRAVAVANFRVTCNADSPSNGFIDICTELFHTSVFESFYGLYQYYKVSFVEIIVTPSPVQGTLPPMGFMILQGNEDLQINYNEMPENPCCKIISNRKVTFTKFTRPGRNPDFNYWYNTLTSSMPTTAAARVCYRFTQPILTTQGLGYKFRVKWHLKFSNYFVRANATKKLEEKDNVIKRDENAIVFIENNVPIPDYEDVTSQTEDEIITSPSQHA